MDDLNRKKLDAEISRLHDKAKTLEPDTEKYAAIHKIISNLTELANDDDEARNRYDIEKDRLDTEASIEAAKRGMEEEKLQLERDIELENAKRKEVEDKQKSRDCWIAVISTAAALAANVGLTVYTWNGSWRHNSQAQYRAELFESTGHAYTSKASKWQLKEPNHPNPNFSIKK